MPTCSIPLEQSPAADGRWNEAASTLEQARDRDPRNLSVLWSLFESYLALHEYTKADGNSKRRAFRFATADFLSWPAARLPYFAMAILLRSVRLAETPAQF